MLTDDYLETMRKKLKNHINAKDDHVIILFNNSKNFHLNFSAFFMFMQYIEPLNTLF